MPHDEPVVPGAPLPLRLQVPLQLNTQCELALYRRMADPETSEPPENWGICFPNQIIACAQALGFDAMVIHKRSLRVWAMQILYSEQYDDLLRRGYICRENSAMAKHFCNTAETVALYQLKILAHSKLSRRFHTVVVQPDGSVMDPAVGDTFDSVEQLKQASHMHGTGLSIYLKLRKPDLPEHYRPSLQGYLESI